MTSAVMLEVLRDVRRFVREKEGCRRARQTGCRADDARERVAEFRSRIYHTSRDRAAHGTGDRVSGAGLAHVGRSRFAQSALGVIGNLPRTSAHRDRALSCEDGELTARYAAGE